MNLFEFNKLNLILIFIFLLVFYILYCIADTKELLNIPPPSETKVQLAQEQIGDTSIPPLSAKQTQGISSPSDISQTIPLLKSPNNIQNINGDDGQIKNTTNTMDEQPAGIGPCRNKCGSNEDCNIVFGRGQNKCVNGRCSCVSGTGTFCHLRPNYYKNPREMTPAQIIKFKNDAQLSKMTLQDYKNWLSLFEFDLDNLPKIHLANYNRVKSGLPVYDIPLADPVDEFFASSAARRDRVCMDIPNADIDSPLNWKLHSSFNNMGNINSRGETNVSLPYAQYTHNNHLDEANVFSTERTYERENNITIKDWFLNNINWIFDDIDRNAMWRYNDPNQNRFLNIIENKGVVPKQATLLAQKLLADEYAAGKKSIPEPVAEDILAEKL